jgi:hypothetical protein
LVEGSHHAARASLTGRRARGAAPGRWRVALATSHGVDFDRNPSVGLGSAPATSVCLHCRNLGKRSSQTSLADPMCAASAASQPGLSTGDTPREQERCARSVKAADLEAGLRLSTYCLFAIAKKPCAMGQQLRWPARVCAVLQPFACPSTCSSVPLASRVEPHLGPTVDVRRNSAFHLERAMG